MNIWQIVILIVCMAIELCILYSVYKMIQSLKIKRSCACHTVGKILSYKEIPGRPTWYKIVVEYEMNGIRKKVTIHTVDCEARRLKEDEKVLLRCSKDLDKVFWAEEADNGRIVITIIMGIMAIVLLVIIVFATLGMILY